MQQHRFAMRITALSAMLLAGATALVSAAPVDNETTERVSYTGKTQRAAPATNDDGWIEIASPTPASHGREYIEVDGSAGPLVRLRIAGHRGRTIVQTVRIDFQNGKSRTVRIDRVVSKDKPAYVDLRGPQRVERVIVATERAPRAEYTVQAEPAGGAVARR